MNNIAFITGVSRGLGESLAAQLLDAGWSVIGIGRSASPRLVRAGFEWMHGDFEDVGAATAAARTAMQSAAAQSPSRALLINNAAVAGPVGRIGQLLECELAASLAVNLVAPTALANVFCHAFGDARVARRIINVTSGLAERAMSGASLYSIAKSGLEMLTRALAVDHPEPSFAAVTLRPGIIDTGMQVFMRSQSTDHLPDAGMFRNLHDSGQLVAADRVAQVSISQLVDRDVESGRTYNYAELAASASSSSAGVSTRQSASPNSSRDP